MTVPRELTLLHNGKHLIVASYPVAEINTLRGKKTKIANKTITTTTLVESILKEQFGVFELNMTIKPQQAKIFGFSLMNESKEKVKFIFDLNQRSIMVDRKESGMTDFHPNFASIPFAPLSLSNIYHVRLLVDKASSEIFINEGEIVLTNIHFTSSQFNQLEFFKEDGHWSAEDISIYELKR